MASSVCLLLFLFTHKGISFNSINYDKPTNQMRTLQSRLNWSDLSKEKKPYLSYILPAQTYRIERCASRAASRWRPPTKHCATSLWHWWRTTRASTWSRASVRWWWSWVAMNCDWSATSDWRWCTLPDWSAASALRRRRGCTRRAVWTWNGWLWHNCARDPGDLWCKNDGNIKNHKVCMSPSFVARHLQQPKNKQRANNQQNHYSAE